MPQVYMILDPSALTIMVDEEAEMYDLSRSLIRVTERVFCLEGKDDVACTIVKAVSTMNEAPIQVEVRYTAGENEYHTGTPFDPPKDIREQLANELIAEVRHHFRDVKVSAWIKPYYRSVFKLFSN